MTKKLRIDAEDREKYRFAGIVCHLPDYRFFYILNRNLRMNFIRMPDLPVFFDKENTCIEFPMYHYMNTISRQEFFGIGCRSENYFLMPELRQHDYFLIRIGESQLFNEEEFVSGIKSIEEVLMVNMIEYERLKQVSGLLVDLEMHMSSLIQIEKGKNNPFTIRQRYHQNKNES